MLLSTARRRVLFISSQRWGSGPAVFLRKACGHLPSLGWQSKLLLTGTRRRVMFDISEWPCEVELLSPSYSWTEHAGKMGKAISNFNPSVVVGTAIHGPALGMRYLYNSGELRARFLDTVLVDELFEYERVAANADVATMIGAISDELVRRLRAEVPEVADRTRRMLMPISCLKTLAERSHRNETLRLAYVGRIAQHDKRIMDFVPLVRELLLNNVSFSLTFVGDGAERNKLYSALSKIPRALERIRFVGWISNEDVLETLKNHDAIVLMSEVEGQPFAILEAMGRGVVPVVSDLPGTREVVSDGESGFLVAQGKIKEFAHRLSQLARSRETLQQMSQAAWKTVQKGHSHNTALEAFASMLDETAGKPLPKTWGTALTRSSRNLMTRLCIPHSVQGVKRKLLGQEIH